jgi:pyruvate-ferredoxin/flavodoxin oxidoreductase
VYGLDTVKVAREVASKPDLVQRMQGIVLLGVFLKATPYAAEKGMNEEVLMAGVEKGLKKYFGKRGEQVVKDNMTCVVRGYKEVVEIPAEIMAQE